MFNVDGKIASELVEEKTDEELAEALSGYQVKRFSWWRVSLSVLAVATMVIMGTEILDLGSHSKSILGESMLSDSYFSDMEKKLDEIKQEKLDRYNSDPMNKGYLMDYVISSFSTEKDFIKRMLKNAELTDPENSLYYYLAATVDTSKYDGACIEKVESADSSGISKKDLGRIIEWKVLDREKYERALNYIKEAGKRQGIIDHSLSHYLEKLEKLRLMKEQKKLDGIEEFLAMAELMVNHEFHVMKMLDLTKIFGTKFYELSKKGTEEEVRLWIDEYIKLTEVVLPEQGSLVDYLVAEAVLKSSLGNMRAAARHVGMNEEVQKITRCIAQLNADAVTKQTHRDARKSDEKDSELMVGKSYSKDSFLMQLSGSAILRHAIEQDKIVLPSTKEGRFANHAFAGRLLTLLTAIFIALAMIGMWIFFFAKRKEIKVMGMQSLGALTIIDGLLIVFGGVILPVVLYIIINEHTALGVREWSVLALQSALAVIQFVGMFATVLTLSMALLRWRLSVRLPDLISKERILGWVLPAMSFVAMIIIGMSDAKDETLPWKIAGMLISLSLLGWLIIVGVGAFRKKAELAKVTICRGMISIYAFTLIVFTGLYHYYHAQEKSMVAASEEITFKREHLGLTTIEYRTAQQMRKELKERLELIR